MMENKHESMVRENYKIEKNDKENIANALEW